MSYLDSSVAVVGRVVKTYSGLQYHRSQLSEKGSSGRLMGLGTLLPHLLYLLIPVDAT